MSSAGGEGSSQSRKGKEREEDGAGGSGPREEGVQVLEVDLGDLYGSAAGWVEARTSCPHLSSMPAAGADDLACVPPPDSPCSRFGSSSLEFPAVPFRGREQYWVKVLLIFMYDISHEDIFSCRCHHPAENWLCLICKDVLCSRFINKHMLLHYQEAGHCLALSFSDLSVWCFACDSYLDIQAILELRPVYEVAHLLKFGEHPPFRSLDVLDLSCGESGSSSSQA
ncbi:hypothetical protein PR202_ga12339 [Eleusine coracana subsp. coracana]|uniref:UBP-type domain-containing protein n=1 Tax=Eleusine coracana subsp. coracana TaxID=191504 RepID=A0AAV5CBU6_ELECO|nr:hypothetical protein PR202_ga12339 [Eleusine coracana subsp. coracana]